jgi:excisionase family DNA binding protein
MPVKMLTTHEVADFLNCNASTVYRMAADGKIPAFRIGSDWHFPVEELHAWIRSRTINLPTSTLRYNSGASHPRGGRYSA